VGNFFETKVLHFKVQSCVPLLCSRLMVSIWFSLVLFTLQSHVHELFISVVALAFGYNHLSLHHVPHNIRICEGVVLYVCIFIGLLLFLLFW